MFSSLTFLLLYVYDYRWWNFLTVVVKVLLKNVNLDVPWNCLKNGMHTGALKKCYEFVVV